MTIAELLLLGDEEALRCDQMQLVAGARHGDIKQPAFFLELMRRAGSKIGGDAAIDDIEDVDRFPFLALGGMDGRKDKVVLVLEGGSRLIRRGVRRIEGELGEETLAAR